MGRIFADTLGAGRDAIFAFSLLAVLAYSRWHFWWRTGFGRTRMILLLSIAALSLTSMLDTWTGVDYDFSSIPDDATAAADTLAIAGVLTWVSYMLCRMMAFNIKRVRDPYFCVMQGRRHIEQTPGASKDEIEKLVACWDEQHTYQRESL